jgi:hypothetical protein
VGAGAGFVFVAGAEDERVAGGHGGGEFAAGITLVADDGDGAGARDAVDQV